MARPPDTLENPITGERITFLNTAQDASGELLRIGFRLRPGGFVPNAHIHPCQSERFEVLSGTMRGRVGRRRVCLNAGEAIVVPAGVPHTWWNGGDGEVGAIFELRPALNSEAM